MKNRISKNILIILVLLITSCYAEAQNFYGGITSGLVISQVDGDDKDGYHKISPIIGVYARNTFNNNWGISMGLSYKRKGARDTGKDEFGNILSYYSSTLDYIELPILAKYKINKFKIPSLIDYTFKRNFFFDFGISYSYLINDYEDFGSGKEQVDPRRPFKKYDFSWHLGCEYAISKHFIIGYSYSYTFFFLPIRNHPGKKTYYFNRGLYNNNMNFIIKYEF